MGQGLNVCVSVCLCLCMCVWLWVCLGYKGVGVHGWVGGGGGGGADLTQKASRRPGRGWQWLWESRAGERRGGGGEGGRAGTGLSGVLFGEGGENASSFTPLLRQATANGDGSLKGLTLRWPPHQSCGSGAHVQQRSISPTTPSTQPHQHIPFESDQQCNSHLRHMHSQ